MAFGSTLDKVSSIPVIHKLVAVAVIFAAIAFVSYYYLLKPNLDHRNMLEEKYLDLQVELNKQKSIAKKLPEFQKELAILDQRLKRILLELPDQKKLETFMKSISFLARDTGLEVLKFSPLPEIPREFFYELPVRLRLIGNFHKLLTFFDELSRLTGIVTTSDIVLKTLRVEEGKVVLDIDCLVTTYRYDENSKPVEATAK